MLGNSLPAVLLNAVSELSKSHILDFWNIDGISGCTTITLKWKKPCADRGGSRQGNCSGRGRKSPSKKERDFQRYHAYVSRKKDNSTNSAASDLPPNSFPASHPAINNPAPPAAKKMEDATTQCVEEHTPSVSLTTEVHASSLTKPLMSAHELPAEGTNLLQRPARHSSSAHDASLKLEPGGPDDRVSGKHQSHDKIVQCAFDGEMIVGSISTTDFTRQLEQGLNDTVCRCGWCDGCAEPLRSWISCSACARSAYVSTVS